MKKIFDQNIDDVIDLLLTKIADVDIDVPDTYKQRGASARD